MSSFAAARSVLRSSTAGRTALGSRISAGARSKPNLASSPISIPKRSQNRLSRPTFRRSALEMSRCCVGSMLPYHTATASALLTSMLSVSCRTHGWTLEDCNDDV